MFAILSNFTLRKKKRDKLKKKTYKNLERLFFNPCGESDQLVVRFNFAKKIPLKARSEASRQNISHFDFRREASRIFSEAKADN